MVALCVVIICITIVKLISNLMIIIVMLCLGIHVIQCSLSSAYYTLSMGQSMNETNIHTFSVFCNEDIHA